MCSEIPGTEDCQRNILGSMGYLSLDYLPQKEMAVRSLYEKILSLVVLSYWEIIEPI